MIEVNTTRRGCSWILYLEAFRRQKVEVAAVGEHNSPSRPTPERRDQFQVHQLTGDIGQDGTLPSPERDSSRLDDDSPAK